MADRDKPARAGSNRLLAVVLALVGLALYLSIQLVWGAKGY